MGLGVLESRQHAPGTVQLIEDHAESAGKENVVLVPHPSQSPNDPLNWPTWKKDVVLFSIAYATALAYIQGGSLAVVTAQLATQFDVSLTRAETQNVYWFLAVAVACVLSSVTARIFGKRIVYLLAMIILFVSAAWNAAATSFNSLLASRIVYGLGLGAFESLPWSSIGDMYFVHQRGRRTAAFSFMSLGCYQLAPVLGGYLADTYGWRIALWILVAFYGTALLLVIFALPETDYSRPLRYETDIAPEVADEDADDRDGVASRMEKAPTISTDLESASEEEEAPLPYWKQLVPCRKINRVNPLRLVLRYFSCIFYPIVWYAFLIPSMYLGWTVLLNTTLAQIFAFPPISFSFTHMGYLNTFCFPLALAAYTISHALSDQTARILAKRNKNVYEPEFRLVLMLPGFLLTPLAFCLFGWYTGTVAQTTHISWVAASFLYGMLIFCLVNVNIVAFAYLLDAHREISIEAGVFAIMLRNFWNYGVASFASSWLNSQGVANAYYEIAGISFGAVLLLTTLFWVYGKRMRGFMHANDPMRFLHVRVAHNKK